MFSKKEKKIIESLDSPYKVQIFLNKLKANLIRGGSRYKDTCRSPKGVLKERRAHCIEGAVFAAAVLRHHGYPPLIVDLEATKDDLDHVIYVFRKNNRWGAVSKTNHAVLRYREPVYKNIRELVMSYFHEYTDKVGNKTLRKFSSPINLKRFDKYDWMMTEKEIWYIPEFLTKVKHHKILTNKQVAELNTADKIEVMVGNIKEYKE
jgi:hypothetical protein